MEQIDTRQDQAQVLTKPCGICQKPIEEPKLRIHEATCARNNYKCQQCGEVVAKAEKENHDLEQHTKVSSIY